MANSKNYIYRLYLHKNIEKPSEQKGTLRIGNGEEKIKMKIGEAEFELTLNGLKFYRKLYEPSVIHAEVMIASFDNNPLPSMSVASEIFLNRMATLTMLPKDVEKAEETVLAENFFVFETIPQVINNNGKTSLYVKLVVNSLDKLMTIDKYSQTYVSKKLGSGILMPESRTFGYDNVSYIKTNAKHLQSLRFGTKVVEDGALPTERIQPYLVQYNESFYDFMARTSNRCGEFLFFENGELIMGLPSTNKKYREAQTIQTISDYASITLLSNTDNPLYPDTFYRDSVKNGNGEVETLNFETMDKSSTGFPKDVFPDKPAYNAEVANDEFVYPLIPDKWTNFNYEMGYDPKYGSGESFKGFGTALALSLIGNQLLNTQTDTVLNAIDFIINLAGAWGGASAKVFWFINMHPPGTIDEVKNKKHIEDQHVNTPFDQKNSDMFVGFSTMDPNGWVSINFYKDIRQKQTAQQKKIICIDMGVNIIPVKMGDMIQVNGMEGTYVVIRIDMISNVVWTRNYKTYDAAPTDSDLYSGRQSMVIYAIPTFMDSGNNPTAIPPMVVPDFRKAGPQTAYVVDSDDPKYQGRVRIVYPWQTKKERKQMSLKEVEVDLKKAQEEQEMAAQLYNELLLALKNLKSENSIFAELVNLDDEKREQRHEELKARLAEVEKKISDIELPKDTTGLSYSEILNYQTKKQDLEKLENEREVLKAVLKILDEGDLTDISKILDDLEEKCEAKAKELEEAAEKKNETIRNIESKEKTLKDVVNEENRELLHIASPWVRVATPAASAGGGTYFKPQIGDEVLINYDNDNVERPYVVGSLFSKNLQTPEQRLNPITKHDLLQNASTYIMSPNGHHIVFNDPVDGTKLVSGIQGGLGTLLSAVGLTLEGVKDMTGGIHIGDRYGFYELSMCSHNRKVELKSPFGDVSIDAFTGITLNAPNGDIKINGKNVEITAGNNLIIRAGENIQKPVACHPKKSAKLGGVATAIPFGILGGVIDNVVGPFIDMTFIRHFAEVILRPIEGTMQIRSNRYLKLEAGIDSYAQIPAKRYEKGHKRNKAARNEIIFLAKIVNCIQYMDTTVNNFMGEYMIVWNNAYETIESYKTLLRGLLNDQNQGNMETIAREAAEKGAAKSNEAAWGGNVIQKAAFEGKIKDGEVTVDGKTYNQLEQKENVLVKAANGVAMVVFGLFKHKQTFENLFAAPNVNADNKMKELLRDAFNGRKGARTEAWDGMYKNGNQFKAAFLESKIKKDETKDPFVSAAKKFKRAVAADFLARVANADEYQMSSTMSDHEDLGNKFTNFLRNPLDSKAKGRFLHLHYEPADVKEDRMESEFHWHHFIDKMQKPKNAFNRKLYDNVVGKAFEKLQVKEFAKIHDREVWADRGYGTILMSDQRGETRVFDSGRFTVENQASKGNWGELIRTLKSIK